MTIEQMKQELIGYGYEENTLDLKKPELQKLMDGIRETEKSLDNIVIMGDGSAPFIINDEILPVEVVPKPWEIGWTDYVMKQFDEKRELDNGAPKVDGLRRVAHQLLGDFSIDTTVLQVPDLNNAGRASVIVKIQFDNGHSVSGAADVFTGNTPNAFAIYPVSTCETRAEGRALRKALRLVKVLTAEEMEKPEKDEPTGLDGRSPSEMTNGLHLMAQRLKIDLFKLAIKQNFNIEVIEDLTLVQAKQLNLLMGQMGRSEIEIPNEVKV